MDKDFSINKLDETTLKFAIEIAWQYEVLCEKTKDGRSKAEAFIRVQKTLSHYLSKISTQE